MSDDTTEVKANKKQLKKKWEVKGKAIDDPLLTCLHILTNLPAGNGLKDG